MATYEYVCEKCKKHFEVQQSMKDDALKKHPGKCGGKVKRVISGGGGFSLKGYGWPSKR